MSKGEPAICIVARGSAQFLPVGAHKTGHSMFPNEHIKLAKDNLQSTCCICNLSIQGPVGTGHGHIAAMRGRQLMSEENSLVLMVQERECQKRGNQQEHKRSQSWPYATNVDMCAG